MVKDKEYYKKLLEEAIDNDTLLDDDVIAEIEDFLEKEKQRELLQNLKDKEVDEPKDNTKEEEQPQEDNTDGEQPQEETTQEEEPQEETTQEDNTDGEDDKDKKEDKRQSNNIIMNKEFRLINAINDIANNRNLSEVDSAVIKASANDMRALGINASGQIQLSGEKRTISVATADGVVETEVENILAPLRDNNVLVSAGAKFLTNLKGNVKLPVMGASNCTWEDETASAKDAGTTITAKELSPKRLCCYIDVSKQFLIQDSASANATLQQDIVNAISEKLQKTILGAGAGSAKQPAGIFNGATPTTATTFADICKIEGAVDDANVGGNRAYIVSNKAKAGLRNMAKSAKSTQLVMENGEIDGTPVYATSSVEGKNFAYGDFSNLVIAQWGGIDMIVDSISQSTSGCVRLVINAYFDAVVVRPEAIAFGTLA